jgi:hypothetical protein
LGGIYIDCGTFAGEDKSGSAILGVLEGMQLMADTATRAVLEQLIEQVEVMLQTNTPTVQISPNDALVLLSDVRRYRAKLEQRLGSIRDPHIAIHNDVVEGEGVEMGSVRKYSRYGAGLGWQYFCVLDLEPAFEKSIADQNSVVLSWD